MVFTTFTNTVPASLARTTSTAVFIIDGKKTVTEIPGATVTKRLSRLVFSFSLKLLMCHLQPGIMPATEIRKLLKVCDSNDSD